MISYMDYGGFLKQGYPQIIAFLWDFPNIEPPAIGVPLVPLDQGVDGAPSDHLRWLRRPSWGACLHSPGDTPIAGWFIREDLKWMITRGTTIDGNPMKQCMSIEFNRGKYGVEQCVDISPGRNSLIIYVGIFWGCATRLTRCPLADSFSNEAYEFSAGCGCRHHSVFCFWIWISRDMFFSGCQWTHMFYSPEPSWTINPYIFRPKNWCLLCLFVSALRSYIWAIRNRQVVGGPEAPERVVPWNRLKCARWIICTCVCLIR